MKIQNPRNQSRGFSLIELIGVLAIIGILAGIIVPKVIQATARSKVTSTAASYNSLKTAAADYFGKNGTFPDRSGTGATNGAVANGRFDADLIAGGFADKLFTCGIGSQLNDSSNLRNRTHVRSLDTVSNGAVTITANAGGDNFDLDGNASTADFTAGSKIVALMIPDTAVPDAIELNRMLDNETAEGTAANLTGRCIFSAPANNGTTTVYLYVAHH